MTDDQIDVSLEEGVAQVTLDRPDRLNALTFESYRALADRFHAMRFQDEVKVVVVQGRGKGFCGGGDVEDIIGRLFEQDSREVLRFARMTGELVENIRRLDKPVIAAVHGTAAGAGAVIALAADLRVVAETAKFHFLFTKVGLTGADMGAAWLLPRVVGLGRAAEWLYFGDAIDAPTALAAGLANRVVPPEEVQSTALAMARKLARGPGLALSVTKRLLLNEQTMDFASGIEQEAIAQAYLLRAADHRRFYDAWREGRKPEFEGR
jgi:enoyl-CoA hydratase/carnithine racemase